MALFTLFAYEFKGQYQLDPDLFDEELEKVDVDNSVAHKQDIFESFFSVDNFPEYFFYKKRRFGCQMLWKSQNIIAMRLENKKTLKRDIKFQTDELDNYPWVTIIIDNRPNKQHIAILKRPKAFSTSTFVAKIMQETLNAFLHQFRLTITIAHQYHSRVFWETLKKYRPWGIRRIQFNFAYPNLDWATEMIGQLGTFAVNANGDVQLAAEAKNDEVITFDEDKQENRDLVNVCSGTGQDIIIKAKGRPAFHTAKENNPVEVAPKQDDFVKKLEENQSDYQSIVQDTMKFCEACQKYYDV